MSQKTYYVYILASKKNGTLYIGVTNDLERRMAEHKTKCNDDKKTISFTKKYNVNQLVYCEDFNDINATIKREKQLKSWNRQWKIDLINKLNPNWQDLSKNWFDGNL